MNEDWTKQLSKQMEEYQSADIPEGLWEGIEQKIDAPRVVRVRMWQRIAVAASILLVAASMITLYLQKEESSLNQGNTNTPIIQAKAIHTDEAVKIDSKLTASAPSHIARYTESSGAAENEETVSTPEIITEQSEELLHQNVEQSISEEQSKEQSVEETSHPVTLPPPAPHDTQLQRTVARQKNKQHNITLAFHSSQLPGKEANGMSGYLALSSQSLPSNTPMLSAKERMSDFDYMALTNAKHSPVSDAKHDQPIRIGMSVGYDIDEHWGMNTGLTCTRLKSTLTSGTDHSYYSNDQTIIYIGVPVNVIYNFIRCNNLRVYGSLGGMIELGTGDVTVSTIVKNQVISTDNRKLHNVPAQYSANASAGIEYDFIKDVGIFAEPGLSYHFKNSGNIATIYSAHPLNPHLQLGIRWNINVE